MDPIISIIIPALNEEETIGSCLTKIRDSCTKAGLSYEIIIADSSTDKTTEIARSFGARIIHPEKRGYGNAYLSAFPHAKGRVIIIGDADDTYDFSIVPEMVQPILDGKADMVIGSRLKGTILKGSMPSLHKYIGNPLLTRMLNFAFQTKFSDTHSGFRAISNEALNKLSLHTGGMEFASEMLVEAAKKGLKFAEIPITYYPRKGPSKLHSFADGWRHVRFILLMRPLRFLMVPGVLFIAMGIGLILSLLMFLQVEEQAVHSFILGGLFLVGGTQFLLSGLIIKSYAVYNGFDDCGHCFQKIFKYQSLEIMLFIGAIIMIIGFIAGLYVFSSWIGMMGFPLSQMTYAILALISVIIGLQLIFTAINISMMLLKNEQGEI